MAGDVVSEVLQALVLGVVQGATEWLPVSSEGMVSLADRLLFGEAYLASVRRAVLLHAGTLASVLAYFRKDVARILTSFFKHGSYEKRLARFILLSTASTAPVAYAFLYLLVNIEIPPDVFTIVIGVLLVSVSLVRRFTNPSSGGDILGVKTALLTGLVQGFAVIPGVSRSGVTITALLYQGASLPGSLRISYLMGIPVILGAQIVLPIITGSAYFSVVDVVALVISGVVGYSTIGALMKLSTRVDFVKASLYLGIAVILMGMILMI